MCERGSAAQVIIYQESDAFLFSKSFIFKVRVPFVDDLTDVLIGNCIGNSLNFFT